MSSDSEDDIFKILLATDIHLGYKEKDEIRGADSFITFEEILKTAVVCEVDFILLGGDLFHDTNPSAHSLNRCVELLRKYTLGDKPIKFQFLSDQALNFAEAHQTTVNYEDESFNIAYPVFSIHGNHDDPSGFKGISSMDLLSSCGLLNYFGKSSDFTKVELNPILLRKNETNLALYGLSHIHDNRMARLLRDQKVEVCWPSKDDEEYFNLLVLHQNRADRGLKNFVPQEIFSDKFHLVMWGHEHDCRIVPEEVRDKPYYVTQPGSSVATSLSEGEALDKHIGLLYVNKSQQFKIEPIKLKTVRPFVFKTINIDHHAEELGLDRGDPTKKVDKFLCQTVNEMIAEAMEKCEGNEEMPKLPLIRLRVIYTQEEHSLNAVRFGQSFIGKVANHADMIKFSFQRMKNNIDMKPVDNEVMSNVFRNKAKYSDGIGIEQYVQAYFEDPKNGAKLEVLFPESLTIACKQMASKSDVSALADLIKCSDNSFRKFLEEKNPDDDEIDNALAEYRATKKDGTHQKYLAMISNRGIDNAAASNVSSIDHMNDNNQSVTSTNNDSTETNGSARLPRQRAVNQTSSASMSRTRKSRK